MGDVIKFSYKGEHRYVYVIAPEWNNFLHGLDISFVPRNFFLSVVNAPVSKLSEQQLYQQYIRIPMIEKLDAYRTYDRTKITAIYRLPYNRSIQPDERDELATELL